MNNPKVSVLTPIYNHKIEYVEQCLESLKNQTMQDIEFILIDNGATQESKDLIEKYVNLDSRFRAIHLEENKGYSGAMNLGFDSANGEFVGIVESDDWIEANMFERLYEIAKENNVSLVKSCYYEQNLEDITLKNFFKSVQLNKKLPVKDLPDFLLHHASPWSLLYKKDLLNDFKIRISDGKGAVGKDIGLVIKAFLAAQEIYITDEAFYHYNVFNPNASMKVQDNNHILEMLFNEYKNVYNWVNNLINNGSIDASSLAYIDKRLFFNMQCNIKFNKITRKNIKNIAMFLKKQVTNFDFFSKKDVLIFNELTNNPKKYYYEFYKNKKYISLLENIFSVKNSLSKAHKIVTILGLKFKVKRKSTPKEEREFLCRHISRENKVVYDKLKCDIEAKYLHPQIFSPYKNKYEGCDITIVACGPTASYYNPIPSVHIGINRACLLENVNLDFLFVQDWMDEEDMLFADNYKQGYCEKFYAIISDYRLTQVYPKIKRIPDYHVKKANAKQYILKSFMRDCYPFDISYNPISDIGGTTFSALQFAFFTSPQRIFLVGCDCSSGHFHKEGTVGLGPNLSGQYQAWETFKKYYSDYYPNTEIISINPVGLKGMFKDVYTQNYVDEHPELLEEDIEIIDIKEKVEV